ncbi:MAG: RDD family protein, partial [Marinilabiliales bacterium]|nr:RDD family protein [Marinilabiliales bacterium]
MEDSNKVYTMFWRRALSTILDLTFIASMGHLIRLAILQYVFVNSTIVLAIVWIIYYLTCHLLLKGRTIGKIVTGLQFITDHKKGFCISHFLIR